MLKHKIDSLKAPKDESLFQITKEEAEKFQKAFQKKEFRDLFKNYMDEISNPESRKQYEKEIQQLEEERGNSIRWVRPVGHWVIRTTASISNRFKKSTLLVHDQFSGIAYINFASSEEIERPLAKPSIQASKLGATWSLPHSLTAPRPDLDSDGSTVEIYDVLYHPNAYSNPQLTNLLIDTGLQSLEKQFSTTISRSFTILKDIKYKGNPVTTTIRTPLSSNTKADESNFPPHSTISSSSLSSSSNVTSSSSPQTDLSETNHNELKELLTSKVEEPKHEFLYQHPIDLSDFTNDRRSTCFSKKDSLLIRLHLPKVQHAKDIDVKVTHANQFMLNVPQLYFTHFTLPIQVEQDQIKAKWISNKHILELLCPPLSSKVESSVNVAN